MSRRKMAQSSRYHDEYDYDGYSLYNAKTDWNVMPSDDDTDLSDREYDGFLYEDNEEKDPDYGELHDPVKRAQWFDSLKTELNQDDFEWLQKQIAGAVNIRFVRGQPSSMSCWGEIPIGMLQHFKFGDWQTMSTRLGELYSSNVLQKEYVYRMGLHVKPEKLNINGHCVGYKVDLMKLSGIMLKNESLLKSVMNEQKSIDTSFIECNSEVACNTERRNRLLGKLRYIIGIEKYNLLKLNGAKRQYFMFYVCFMNIPLEERIKGKDANLFCVVSESKLRQNGLTVQEVVKSIADELKVMEVDGVDIELLNGGDDLPEMINVKGALAAVCLTKMAMNEILGYRQSRPNAYNCHLCCATESDIEDVNNLSPLIGTDADLEEYDQCLNAISDYEQKKRKKVKTKDNEDEEGDDEVEGKIPKKIVQSAKVYKNRFDVYLGCPFTTLSGVNLWNISPPNVVDDIADGVVGPLMTEFILVHAIKDLSGEEIATKISAFEFGTGKIVLKFEKDTFSFSKGVQSGQKIELLSRFGEIFLDNLNVGHKGYELLETLLSFTKLALSFTIPIDDIPKLQLYSQTLIQLCLDLSSTFKVFPKLHELLHYSDLTQLYGPLIYYAPMKNHKKELLFFYYARALSHCTSVTQTHLFRRQILSALDMDKQKYLSVDLFANLETRQPGLDLVLKFETDRAKKRQENKKKQRVDVDGALPDQYDLLDY